MLKQITDLFKAISKSLGLPDWLVNDILLTFALLGFAAYLLGKLGQGIKAILLWRKQRLLNKDLAAYYSPSDVERTTRYYVPVYY